MTGYNVEIEACSKDLTGKQKVQVKDTTDCVRLDALTAQNGNVVIDVDYWAELSVHNEMADNKDYKNYIICDKDGTRYLTGSDAFWSSFMNIWEEMDGDDEPWKLKVYRQDSKNHPGKDFITCSMI